MQCLARRIRSWSIRSDDHAKENKRIFNFLSSLMHFNLLILVRSSSNCFVVDLSQYNEGEEEKKKEDEYPVSG